MCYKVKSNVNKTKLMIKEDVETSENVYWKIEM